MTRIHELRELIKDAKLNGFNNVLIDKYTAELSQLVAERRKNREDADRLKVVLTTTQNEVLGTTQNTLAIIKDNNNYSFPKSILNNLVYVGGIGWTNKQNEAVRQGALNKILRRRR